MAKKYQRKKKIICQEVDGEMHILDEEKDEIISLNESATLIWKFLAKARSQDEIINKLKVEYDVSHLSAKADVEKLLNKLRRKKLLIE